ncbi:MAG: archease [Verrucomicrobiota bacterium]|nr:archease [Verrucomicrobiota bacterium]
MPRPEDRISRKDLIQFMVGKSLPLSAIARLLGVKRSAVHEELRHVLLSLQHTGCEVEITPGRCRKCGFTFSENDLRKPSRCPACKSTWIADPRITVHEKVLQQAEQPHQRSKEPAECSGKEICEGVELIDHTADVGLVVRASTLALLFERAAIGMFFILTDLSSVVPAQSEPLEVSADDLETLLVAWLSELNYRHVVHHRLYCRFDVTEAGNGVLTAQVHGEQIDPLRHTVHTEIKAVTRHGLKLQKTDAGYEATVIFDL